MGWKRGSFLGVLMVAVGAAFWGTDGVLRVPLLKYMSPTAIVFSEHLFLAAYSVPAVALGWRAFRGFRALHWLALFTIGWGGSALATLMFTEAFALGNPTAAILLQKTQPLFAITLSSLLLRERLGWRYWGCFVVAMAGAYLISFSDLSPFGKLGSGALLSSLFALGAAFLWGSSTVMGRFVLRDLPFHTLTGARLLSALPLLGVIVLWQGRMGGVGEGIAAHPLRVALLALIPGLIALLLYYRGLTSTRASYATLAELAFPATAVVLNWVVLGVGVTPNQIAGFLLLWASVFVLGRLSARSPEPETPSPVVQDSAPARCR
ncbi:MAG: DMT family transporter [Rubrobacteraceae bacterium]|uniref:DMT family transporter n=1 Tax=Rubrobacter naiadicus TaxID=1392641 RepID=UPI002361C1CF|nr:DMT family transporter [Rubrobacter naiadicus]MBX6764264.1 DMT family transporter [Rubrobacteraceae bacterium]MCL6438815.1 DMT family transporter [Rubrobacteraceae bacterium]